MEKPRIWNIVAHECHEPNRLPKRIQVGEGYVGEPFDKLVWYVPEVASEECHSLSLSDVTDADGHSESVDMIGIESVNDK